MSGVTGIELGPNYCVLVRGGHAGSQQTVSAASTLLLVCVVRRSAESRAPAARGP